MRRFLFAVLIPAVLFGQALVVAASAQELRAEIDPRVELMSILFRLAGNQEYNQCRVPLYDQAIDRYFARYRDHEAVQVARSLGVGFEAPMKIAAYVRDVDTLDERVPFDRPSVHLFEKWDAGKARAFLSAARRFAAETSFEDFLASQQPLYEATNNRLQAFLQDKADLVWFIRFFGPPGPAAFVIAPGLANGAPSYAARVIDETGVKRSTPSPASPRWTAKAFPFSTPIGALRWRMKLRTRTRARRSTSSRRRWRKRPARSMRRWPRPCGDSLTGTGKSC